jgi:hypothetical protein
MKKKLTALLLGAALALLPVLTALADSDWWN